MFSKRKKSLCLEKLSKMSEGWRIKSGSNLTVADTRVAEPSKAEGLGIKLSVCDV